MKDFGGQHFCSTLKILAIYNNLFLVVKINMQKEYQIFGVEENVPLVYCSEG